MSEVTISKERINYTIDLLITMVTEEIAEETGRDRKEVLMDFLCSRTGKALYDEEKDEVTIFAVNRNLEEDVELTTDVRSFEGYRILEHIVMENEDLKAGNSLAGEKVYPVNGDERSKLDGGVLTSVIKKASWNVIRLGK